MYHHSQYVFPGNASKVKRHDMSLCSQGIFTKAVQHLLAPPDLPSTFLPWVSGPGSRPFMDCTQRAALSSGFWLSSTNGRHLREIGGREERVQGIIPPTPSLSGHHWPSRPSSTSSMKFTALGASCPKATAAGLSRFHPFRLGGGRGTKDRREC